MIGCLPTQALAFLAIFVYATHATQAIAFEWKPGLTFIHITIHITSQNIIPAFTRNPLLFVLCMSLSNFAKVCLYVLNHVYVNSVSMFCILLSLFYLYCVQIALLYSNVRLSHNKRLLTYLLTTFCTKFDTMMENQQLKGTYWSLVRFSKIQDGRRPS